jgi:hypothetical protein
LRKAFVETCKTSKTFRAPLEYVFDWCTDFREDDVKMTGSKSKRKFLEKTAERIVWIVEYKQEGKTRQGVRVVWPHPPDSWELDTCGDMKEWGEYKLTSKGKNKTRLDMKFRLSHDSEKHLPGKKKWKKEMRELWDTYGSFLEKDYKESLRSAK